MGLFSSSSKTVDNYSNPLLANYTNAYRASAPWEFATLDPTATLAAMGTSKTGTSLGRTNLGVDFKKTLEGMSADEKKQAQAANDALDRIRTRQESGQFLTPQETDFINTNLDKAFQYAHDVGYKDWQLGAQSLAGGRGLRTSDTPVAAPAMAELRNFELGLGSKRAELGLNATMQMSAQQNAFDESLREFQQNLMNSKWQTRQGFMFGGGLQGAGVISSSNTRYNSNSPSVMSSIGQTFDVAQKGLQLAGTAASGMSAGWSSMMPKT